MANAVVLMADGFEEIEAMAIIDILRRGGVEVTLAGLTGLSITSAHGVTVSTDVVFDTLSDQLFDAVVLPGGEPGSTHLLNSEAVGRFVKAHDQAGKWVAAICAAPQVLEKAGILEGRRATSYPGVKDKMGRCHYVEDEVVVDGHIITSRGPATAMAFGYALVDRLAAESTGTQLRQGMLYTT